MPQDIDIARNHTEWRIDLVCDPRSQTSYGGELFRLNNLSMGLLQIEISLLQSFVCADKFLSPLTNLLLQRCAVLLQLLVQLTLFNRHRSLACEGLEQLQIALRKPFCLLVAIDVNQSSDPIACFQGHTHN